MTVQQEALESHSLGSHPGTTTEGLSGRLLANLSFLVCKTLTIGMSISQEVYQ